MRLSDPMLGVANRLSLAGLSMATGPRLSILIFHRVLPQADPIFPAEMFADRFDRFMGLVARSYRVLPLSVAVERLADNALPHRALAITFDDGYADNHDVALPILLRHGVTACFFIATGFLEGGRMFNDTVIESVRRCPLSTLDLGEFGLGSFDLQTPSQRAHAIGMMLPVIKYLRPEERPQALARFIQICKSPSLPDDLMMTRAKVRALHDAGMEIGAHTVRHPILTTLSEADAEREMADSRQALQQIIDHPVSLFAYPNGKPNQDYARKHADMARRLGFKAAVSTAAGASASGADPYQLPRFTPWNQSAWQWLTRLTANHVQGSKYDVA